MKQVLSTFWQGLAERERRMVGLAATVLGLYLLWALAVAPAWRTLRQAPERHATLDAQLHTVRALSQEARALQERQGAQALSRAAALRALETANAQKLGGNGQLSVSGDRVTVTLKAASPEQLAQWLAQVRVNARLLPLEAQLTRAERPPGATAWNGTLVLSGPALKDGS